jgi:hypothetical protein
MQVVVNIKSTWPARGAMQLLAWGCTHSSAMHPLIRAPFDRMVSHRFGLRSLLRPLLGRARAVQVWAHHGESHHRISHLLCFFSPIRVLTLSISFAITVRPPSISATSCCLVNVQCNEVE